MKYVSIDLETTGLDPETCQVLQVGAVIEDTSDPRPLDQLPRFEGLLVHRMIVGEPYAIGLNAGLIKRITDPEHHAGKTSPIFADKINSAGHEENAAWVALDAWLNDRLGRGPWIAAGKNVAGFDMRFFPRWLRKRFHHRVIDPGSVFVDWTKDAPLSLPQLKERFGLEPDVTHDAIEDAIDVIRVLRQGYVVEGADGGEQ